MYGLQLLCNEGDVGVWVADFVAFIEYGVTPVWWVYGGGDMGGYVCVICVYVCMCVV